MNSTRAIFFFVLVSMILTNPFDAFSQTELPDWAIGPFTRYEGNPVMVPEGDGWESQNVYNPGVVRRGNRFYMLYRGESSDTLLYRNYRSQIGLATSRDGIKWKRYKGNPVIRAEYQYELPGGVEDPRLIEYEGTYYAFYTAFNHFDRPNNVRLCVVTSTDLKNWIKHPPLFGGIRMKNASIVVDDNGTPVKINGKFVMYTSVGSDPFICYSTDLLNWELKPLTGVIFPESFKPMEFCIAVTNYEPTNENIVVFLGGRLEGGPNSERYHYALGQALFKKDDPEVMVDYLKEPFMIPEEPYELKGFINYTLFFNTIMKHKGKWWMWYGGADHVIGVATAPVTH